MKNQESKNRPIDLDDFDALAAAHCDGRLNEAGFARLEKMLADSLEARARFLRYMNLESALHEFGEPAGLTWGESAHPLLDDAPAPPVGARWMPWALAASLVALLTLAFWPGEKFETPKPGPIVQEIADPGVAVLAKAVGVEWETPALAVGTAVPISRLKFKAGLMRLEFYSGAAVILEGPV